MNREKAVNHGDHGEHKEKQDITEVIGITRQVTHETCITL